MERGTQVIVIEVNLHCDKCSHKMEELNDVNDNYTDNENVYTCHNKDCSNKYVPIHTNKPYPYLDYQPVSKLQEMASVSGSSSNRVH